jgi:hypothetical protein
MRQFAGKKKVAGVTIGNIFYISLSSQTINIFDQDYLHVISLLCPDTAIAYFFKRTVFSSRSVDGEDKKTRCHRCSDIASYPLFSRKNLTAFGGERQQCNDSRSFDSYCHLSLVFGAIAGYSSGKDFSSFSDEFFQFFRLFVINVIRLFLAKNAHLFSGPAPSISSHLLTPFSKQQIDKF